MKDLVVTWVIVLLFTGIAAQVHGGAAVVFAVPVLAVAVCRDLWRAWRHPELRRMAACRIASWAAGVAVVAVLHAYYADAARRLGDSAVEAVNLYTMNNRHYPQRLEDLGLDAAAASRWYLHYRVDDEGPHVGYMATFMLFDTWEYDFPQHRWEYVRD